MNNYITIELSKTGKKHAGKYLAIIDSVDAELAELNWSVRIAPNTHYATRFIYKDGTYKRTELLHREVLSRKLERDLLPTEDVDHIDGDGLNNRRNNLRVATSAQNGRNRGAQRNNTSGYKGVGWDKSRQKWTAQIKVNGKQKHLGRFDTPEAAHKAYCEAADRLHGKFANYGE
jgi:hypothetical protein